MIQITPERQMNRSVTRILLFLSTALLVGASYSGCDRFRQVGGYTGICSSDGAHADRLVKNAQSYQALRHAYAEYQRCKPARQILESTARRVLQKLCRPPDDQSLQEVREREASEELAELRLAKSDPTVRQSRAKNIQRLNALVRKSPPRPPALLQLGKLYSVFGDDTAGRRMHVNALTLAEAWSGTPGDIIFREAHTSDIYLAAFSRSSSRRWLATAGRDDRVIVWNYDELHPVHALERRRPRSMTFDRRGDRLFIGSDDSMRHPVVMRDLATGAERAISLGDSWGDVVALDHHPGKPWLVVTRHMQGVAYPGRTLVVNIDTDEIIADLCFGTHARFSDDGRVIAVVSMNGIHMIETAALAYNGHGSCIAEEEAISEQLSRTMIPGTGVRKVWFDRDHTWLGAIVSRDESPEELLLWHIETGQEQRSALGGLVSMDFHPRLPDVLTVADGHQVSHMQLFEPGMRPASEPLAEYPGALAWLGFDPVGDDRIFAAGSGGSIMVKIVGQEGPPIIRRGRRQLGRVDAVAFHAPSNQAAVAIAGQGVMVLDVASKAGHLMLTSTRGDDGRETSYRSLAFSAEGQFLAATRSSGAGFEVWDLQEKKRLWDQPRGAIRALAFLPDSGSHETMLLTVSSSGQVSSWELPTGDRRDSEPSSKVASAAISPDGRTLMTGSRIGNIRRWRVESGRARLVTTVNLGFNEVITALQYSPDGEFVLIGASDGTLALWDQQKEEPAIIGRHQATIVELAFLRGAGRFLSRDRDGNTRHWNIRWRMVRKVSGPGIPHEAQFQPVYGSQHESVVWRQDGGILEIWDRQEAQKFADILFDIERDISWVARSTHGYIDGSENGHKLLQVRSGGRLYDGLMAWHAYREPGLLKHVLRGELGRMKRDPHRRARAAYLKRWCDKHGAKGRTR